MAVATDNRQLRDRMHRIDALLGEIEKFKDPQAQARTREIVQCFMDVHGAVLEKILDHVATSEKKGIELIDSLAGDDLVGSLLMLYGLHPLDLEARVMQALEKVRPYLHSHGGNVELLGVEDGVIRLRLQGSCHGCPSSAMTLKTTIEEAIHEKAPDAESIIVEDEAAIHPVPAEVIHGRFALPVLSA